MDRQELLEYFIENYYPRQEIVYRLPVSVPIAEFWPEELQMRLRKAVTLPLPLLSGKDCHVLCIRVLHGFPVAGYQGFLDQIIHTRSLQNRTSAHRISHHCCGMAGQAPRLTVFLYSSPIHKLLSAAR